MNPFWVPNSGSPLCRAVAALAAASPASRSGRLGDSKVWGLGFRDYLVFGMWGSGSRVLGLGVQGSGLRVYDSGFRV